MRKLVLPLLFSACFFSCHSAKINGSAASKQHGWISLSDGKDFKGWHSYGKSDVGSAWVADQGSFHLLENHKDGRGDLVTDKEYSNFHLKLEWKVAPKSNSGIIFFIHEDPAKYSQTYSTGPEMQVLDNDGHPDGKITKHRSGDLYDMIKSSSEPVKPVGQWNKAEIISDHGHLTFLLNGVKIISTTLWDDSWKNLIAHSKFANWPDFGTFHSGHISLQDHGDEVWYRNIEIKEL